MQKATQNGIGQNSNDVHYDDDDVYLLIWHRYELSCMYMLVYVLWYVVYIPVARVKYRAKSPENQFRTNWPPINYIIITSSRTPTNHKTDKHHTAMHSIDKPKSTHNSILIVWECVLHNCDISQIYVYVWCVYECLITYRSLSLQNPLNTSREFLFLFHGCWTLSLLFSSTWDGEAWNIYILPYHNVNIHNVHIIYMGQWDTYVKCDMLIS